jgi:hypothetical protein
MGILARPGRREAALGSVLAIGDGKRKGRRDSMAVSLPVGLCFATSSIVVSSVSFFFFNLENRKM